MRLFSPDFRDGGELPANTTCEGPDFSPALQWSDAPPATMSLALVVDDPDAPDPAAPKRTWVHFVAYNLPASTRGLPPGVRPETLPKGAVPGVNDWGRTGWGGPCPPIGTHRYFFKLYALDAVLPVRRGVDKAALERLMDGHVLAQATLIGTYRLHRDEAGAPA
ncbi:MAG: YbhB/YbcL family Raf kinase inhibitor-like protein [Myxococcales bacterium]